MPSSILNARGQVTIPRAIREKLSLKPGDRVIFLEEDGQVRIVAANLRAQDLRGLLRRPDQPVSLEEMDAAIGTGRGR